jgi:hypothetical protein
MDFLDPQKQKEHRIRLALIYALVGLAVLLATTVLLYRSYGYRVDREGRVIQNGLVFVSSRPSGADIYLDSKKYKDQSNTRLDIPAGQYVLELKRGGYRDWKRALVVEGGKVARYDYPLLFPVNLATETVKQYSAQLGLTSSSPDRRWLLVSLPDQNIFDLYDLNAPDSPANQLTVPAEVMAAGTATKGWQEVEWADNNRHVLLLRSFDRAGQAGSEYILFDRENPAQSRNLSVILGLTPTDIELRGGDFDKYYLFDQASAQVFTATLDEPTPKSYLDNTVAFTSEEDRVLFVTTRDAPTGKLVVRLKRGDNPSVRIRDVPAGTNYLLDMAVYDGALLAAAGAGSENRVPVFRDPEGALRRQPDLPLIPIQILKVTAPTHVSFSGGKRFVMAQNADSFSVYDAETDRSYAFKTAVPLDGPQTHATWMDGFHLTYVSGGNLVVFDYDGTNLQSLLPASPALTATFDRDFRFLYTVNPQNALTSTALLTQEDQ